MCVDLTFTKDETAIYARRREGTGRKGGGGITLLYRELLGAVFDRAAVSLQEQGTSNSLRQIGAMKYPRTEKFQVA